MGASLPELVGCLQLAETKCILGDLRPVRGSSTGLSCLGVVDSQVKSVFPQDDALPWVLCKKSPELAAILDESDVLPLQDDPEVLVPPDIYMFKLMEGSSSIS